MTSRRIDASDGVLIVVDDWGLAGDGIPKTIRLRDWSRKAKFIGIRSMDRSCDPRSWDGEGSERGGWQKLASLNRHQVPGKVSMQITVLGDNEYVDFKNGAPNFSPAYECRFHHMPPALPSVD